MTVLFISGSPSAASRTGRLPAEALRPRIDALLGELPVAAVA
ncbi:hypothetical protein [Nonomuraea sp. NEAU-A123]|nr:hypothetical protein [Nonomuraea sp. NEAU-A123]